MSDSRLEALTGSLSYILISHLQHFMNAGAANPFASFGASPGGAFAQQPSSPAAPFGQSSGMGFTIEPYNPLASAF